MSYISFESKFRNYIGPLETVAIFAYLLNSLTTVARGQKIVIENEVITGGRELKANHMKG